MTLTALHPNGCNGAGCRICHLTAHDSARQESYGITTDQAAAWLAVNEWAKDPIVLAVPTVRLSLAPQKNIVSLACVHRGQEMRLEKCPTCKGGSTMAKIFACDLYGECTLFRKPISGVAGCTSCQDRTLGKCEHVLINLTLSKYCRGLGDAITWAWLAEGCDRKLEFCAKGYAAKMLRLFGQTVHDDKIGVIVDDCYLNELSERSRHLPRWQVWYQTLGVTGTPKRPAFAVQRETVPGLIGLAPDCAAESRTWPRDRWDELAARLESAGRSVLWITEANGWTYEECAQQIATCELLIGNDSFPAHMAGHLEVPALVLFGSSRPTALAHYSGITAIDKGRKIDAITVEDVFLKVSCG